MAQEQKIMLPPDVNTQQLMMILNHVYPVGSYYETSDEDFDPNDSFVGEWSLEESGRVHVSAGTDYAIGSKGGNKDAIIPYHNHGLTRSTNVAVSVSSTSSATITGGSHEHQQYGWWSTGSGNDGAAYITTSNRERVRRDTENATHTHSLPAHTHGFTITQPVFTCDYVGTSGNTTNANMQPYIVVNRWHRDR